MALYKKILFLNFATVPLLGHNTQHPLQQLKEQLYFHSWFESMVSQLHAETWQALQSKGQLESRVQKQCWRRSE